MVSFSCEACADVVAKKKLDQHRNQCRGASFSCLDCGVHFQGTEYRNHTSCISEAQKYQGSLYREKDKKRKTVNWDKETQDMVPRRAYVEDVAEGDDSQIVAVIDVPPKAPSPPPAMPGVAEVADGVNVFDFLVTEDSQPPVPYNVVERAPSEERRLMEHPVHYGNGEFSQYSQYSLHSQGHPSQFMQHGFSYGTSPVPPSYARYDSWPNLGESQNSQGLEHAFVTPAPKEHRKDKKDKDKRVSISDNSEKKRKRHQVEELDLSSVKRPSSRDQVMTDAPRDDRVLHSGLTGGLSKLVTGPEFYEDRIDSGPTPILSPIKRSRRERDEDGNKADRRKSAHVSYSVKTIKPEHTNGDKKERTKYHDDTHRRRERSPNRKTYHDDKYHRSRSAERTYHDDKHHHLRPSNNGRHASLSSSEDRPNRKTLRVIEYATDRDRPERPASVQPNAMNQIVSYSSRADLFLSYIKKGPDSERGCSINKVLKRYHRERDVRGEEKEDDDKELWKALRLRKNERGEIVLFID